MTLNGCTQPQPEHGKFRGQISPVFQQINDKRKMREKELLQFKRDLKQLKIKTVYIFVKKLKNKKIKGT